MPKAGGLRDGASRRVLRNVSALVRTVRRERPATELYVLNVCPEGSVRRQIGLFGTGLGGRLTSGGIVCLSLTSCFAGGSKDVG